MEELLGARVLSAATQPLRDFAAVLRREFLMAGFEAIDCSCEYFPCRGAWYSLVCRLSSSCCCSVESHGEAAMDVLQPWVRHFLTLFG